MNQQPASQLEKAATPGSCSDVRHEKVCWHRDLHETSAQIPTVTSSSPFEFYTEEGNDGNPICYHTNLNGQKHLISQEHVLNIQKEGYLFT